MKESSHVALDRAFRQERAQVLATLIGWLRDFQLAEDALQDAFVSALEHWVADGVPRRPAAWLVQVARRKALDRIRRSSGRGQVRVEALDERIAAELEDWDAFEEIPDERLQLIFTCCHPALPQEAQIALTLQTLGGLTTAEIARAFLVPLPTIAQRLVRAKRKIKDTGIPFQVPPAHDIAERLDVVLHIIYLIFTEGYSASAGATLLRVDLCEEAIRLGRVLLALTLRNGIAIPTQQAAEARGLVALMLLHHARSYARTGTQGELVLLNAQNRTLWNRVQIGEGVALLESALQMGAPGPYQLQAAIAALHAQAQSPEATDWSQIALLYGKLVEILWTPVIALNHAVALGMAYGPHAALPSLEALGAELSSYHPYHVAHAEMLRRSGQIEAARATYLVALDLCANDIEREYILQALGRCQA